MMNSLGAKSTCSDVFVPAFHRFQAFAAELMTAHSRTAIQSADIRLAVMLLVLLATAELQAAESIWVKAGTTGRLIYVPDAQGDRILDFSSVGYHGRGTELLPESITNQVVISPIVGDDTAQIQAAINQVSTLPIGPGGYRGAVLLQPGTYDIGSLLDIRASGVVLRGSGNNTVLHGRNPLTGSGVPNQRPLIRVYGNGNRSDVGSTRNMVDKVVPAGATSFRVNSTTGFAVGDTVRIERPSTQQWIDAIGMNNPPDGDPPWEPGSMNLRYDRVITRIEGDRLFIDAPLANSFELQYGGGTIREYSWAGAIQNIGIESLRGDSDFDSPTDEDHAWDFISIGDSVNANRAQNVWVRDIEVAHFGGSAVVANPGSKWVTVSNAVSHDPVSQVTGERRYTFDLSGELGFVTESQADNGRHDFVNNSTRPAGPNVFHNSSATNALNDSGPHQRWASGTLFDNITVDGDAINVRNRGSLGTSHGWTGSNMVIWNSEADSFAVQNPPTTQNWLIGSRGTIVENTEFGPQPSGNYDQSGPTAAPVTAGGKTSLYEAQAADSANIVEFRAENSAGSWSSASTWNQKLIPIDSYRVSSRDYLIGDIDGFTFDGASSVDNVGIDPAWQTAVAGSSALPITRLDDLSGNENVAFTIQHSLDSGEKVIHGTLALALREAGGLPDSDFIRLFDMAPENRKTFAELGWDTQLSSSTTFVGVLDLGAELDHLQAGNINVQINDGTGLDWALYTATVATPRGDSSSTRVIIEAGSDITLNSMASIGELKLGEDSPATLSILADGRLTTASDFTQGENAILRLELNESLTTPIQIGGIASLAGALEVTLPAGYIATPGDEISLISADSLSGSFDTFALPAVNDLAWTVIYGSDSVDLVALYAADFNKDGNVDDEDLGVWQSAFGSNSLGDADGDSDTDGRDFLIWQRQFGNAVALGTVTTSVPEPSTISIVFLLLVCSLALRNCPTHAGWIC
jgi:hypothetical protein